MNLLMHNSLIVVMLGIFSITAFAYGDLGTHLPKNFCKDLCPSQTSQKHFIINKIDLVGQDIACLDFSGSNLQGSNLTDAFAVCTNFTKANLSGANLSNTNVLGANFTDANLALASATSKLNKTSPDASRVINFYSIDPYGFQGLFFHGLDLSKGSINEHTRTIKRQSSIHNY